MNIISLLTPSKNYSNKVSNNLSDDEPLRLIGTASDIIVTLACTVCMFLFGFALMQATKNMLASVIGVFVLLQFFSFLFLIKKRVNLAGILFPTIGSACVVSAFFSYPNFIGSAGPLQFAIISCSIAIVSWLFWTIYKTPMSVAKFVNAIFFTIFIVVLKVIGKSDAAWALIQTMILTIGITNIIFGIILDKKDPERISIKSDVAYYFHSIGSVWTLYGFLIFSFVLNIKFGAKDLFGPGTSIFYTLLGLAWVGLGLKLNRKSYSWAGVVCMSLWTFSLTKTILIPFSIFFAFCIALYYWDDMQPNKLPKQDQK